MLDTLGGDVRGHLTLAAGVLADLRPRGRSGTPSSRSATHDRQEIAMSQAPNIDGVLITVGRPALLPGQPRRQGEAAAQAERPARHASAPPPSASASKPPWCAVRRR